MKKIITAIILALSFSASNNIFAAEKKTVIIDTPNLCQSVERVVDDNVYLLPTDKNCVQGGGKVSIEIDSDVRAVNIYSGGSLWKKQDVSGLSERSSDSIKAANFKARNQTDQLADTTGNRHDNWAQVKATEFAAVVNAPDFQKRVQIETERLKKEIFSKPIEEYYKEDNNVATKGSDAKSGLSKNERVYVFVSSSMPLQTLRNYVSAIDKAKDPNVVMVIRGFLNGIQDINSTLIFASRVLSSDPACENSKTACPTYSANLQIDPLLFRRYGVNQVPSVVYASNVKLLASAGSEGLESNASVQHYYKLAGDAALDYHIETINKEVHQKSLEGLVQAMRKGFY